MFSLYKDLGNIHVQLSLKRGKYKYNHVLLPAQLLCACFTECLKQSVAQLNTQDMHVQHNVPA